MCCVVILFILYITTIQMRFALHQVVVYIERFSPPGGVLKHPNKPIQQPTTASNVPNLVVPIGHTALGKFEVPGTTRWLKTHPLVYNKEIIATINNKINTVGSIALALDHPVNGTSYVHYASASLVSPSYGVCSYRQLLKLEGYEDQGYTVSAYFISLHYDMTGTYSPLLRSSVYI